MSREIKFRAWDKSDNVMYETLCFEDMIKMEIMQFTGLKDKNGKEIYEGDILSNIEHGHKFKIQWGIEGESYAGWAGNWLGKDFITPLFNSPLKNCKIIGNIYSNPELLNETN